MPQHRKWSDSFRVAAHGFLAAVREERNMRFHLCTACYVYLFSLFYPFSATQYMLITLMVCGVIALELVNSSIERTVERPSPDRYMTAGTVKDMAAAAVLVFSVGCAVCGVILFWDVPVLLRIWKFAWRHPVLDALFVLSLIGAYRFVFYFGKGDK